MGVSVSVTSGDPSRVLSHATLEAGKFLGLTQADLSAVIGRHRTNIAKGLNPESKEGELAMMLIRCYRSLYALLDGNAEHIKHWMRTENHGTGGVPAEQIRSIQGLYRVQVYLDAMRGKL